MFGSEKTVVDGFKKTIKEQAENKDDCNVEVSLFKFSTKVTECFVGKEVDKVGESNLEYNPHGCTALYDAIGTAVDKIGSVLADRKEEDRPRTSNCSYNHRWS